MNHYVAQNQKYTGSDRIVPSKQHSFEPPIVANSKLQIPRRGRLKGTQVQRTSEYSAKQATCLFPEA
jgi:hypothetical protein